jgi:hypothetical protein
MLDCTLITIDDARIIVSVVICPPPAWLRLEGGALRLMMPVPYCCASPF